MKRKTQFYCEKCGAAYDTQAECKACEEFHIEAAGIPFLAFKPKAEAVVPYPEMIIVEMKDGKKAGFTFAQMLEEEEGASE